MVVEEDGRVFGGRSGRCEVIRAMLVISIATLVLCWWVVEVGEVKSTGLLLWAAEIAAAVRSSDC